MGRGDLLSPATRDMVTVTVRWGSGSLLETEHTVSTSLLEDMHWVSGLLRGGLVLEYEEDSLRNLQINSIMYRKVEIIDI